MRKIKTWLGWPIILFTVLSCTGKSTEILGISSTSYDTSQGLIITASWDGNHRALTYYDINGNYLFHRDFRTEVWTPRGIELLDSETIIVAGEGNDAIYTFDFEGNSTLFFGASTLNGNIFSPAYDSVRDRVYVIESNGIEAFDSTGLRVTADYIATNTGACTLQTPVAMIINSAGNLVVANVGGADNILTYDISTSPPTCISSVAFGNNPYALLQHSDGNLYIATTTDDQVYRADADGSNPVVVWATNTAVLNNPQALEELPNGNLLVSGANNDSIEEITTAGVRVGTAPFIRNALSLNVGNILVIPGTSQ